MNSKLCIWFPLRPFMAFASAGSSLPGSTPGDSGGGAPAGGTGGGAPGAGAPGPGAGSGTPAAGAGAAPDNIAQLRTAYEALKAKHEPYEKLGEYEQVSGGYGAYQKVFAEVSEIGTALGYPEDEIAEAMREAPIETLDYLRRQYAEAESGAGGGEGEVSQEDLRAQVEAMVSEGLQPVYERENVTRTENANALFDRTVYGMIGEALKKEGADIASLRNDPVAKHEIECLILATREIMKWDADGIKALKFEGKTAAVQKAFNTAQNLFESYYVARGTRERNKIVAPGRGAGGGAPGAGGAGAGGAKKGLTLDEMIDDPGKINPKYAAKV
jgi:hypothetical protein